MFFFFSSRRRHTRFKCDWSSDVCSSDLLAGPQTKRLDLGGRVVIPGINDAHYHCDVEPSGFRLRLKGMDPTGPEVAEEVASAEAKAPKGMLVLGEIGPTALDAPQATRASLDKLAPNHPVVLHTWAQHAAILNSSAFAKLGVKEDEPDPLGGRFVRSADGKLTGLVYEYAKFRLDRRLSDLATDAEALRQAREFLSQAVRLGITSVQDMSMNGGTERCALLLEKAPTPIRIRVIRMAGSTSKGRDTQERRSLPRNPVPFLTVRATSRI